MMSKSILLANVLTTFFLVWSANSGNAKFEPGAVVCRVSPSFVRFGSFQLPASRGEPDSNLVQPLADHVIQQHYPHLKGESSPLGGMA